MLALMALKRSPPLAKASGAIDITDSATRADWPSLVRVSEPATSAGSFTDSADLGSDALATVPEDNRACAGLGPRVLRPLPAGPARETATATLAARGAAAAALTPALFAATFMITSMF